MLRLNLVLEEGFSEWWEAYLLYTLEVLKTFRQWGDDEKQLLAIALAENRWGDGAGGLTLSAIAQATGMPAETARRNLAQMVGAGHCDRAGDLYRLIVSDDVRVQVEVQARTFARAMQARLAGLGIFVRPPTASEYLASVLRYIANVRRLFGRGSQVASAVAGMVVISGSVHRIMVTEGERRVARAVYNEKVRLLGGMLFHAAQISQLSGEPMEKVRSAMRHAEAMGAISIVGRDLWSYNASAVTIPGDDEAYTRGVKEALGRFVCLPEPRTAEAVEAVLPGWPGRSSEA